RGNSGLFFQNFLRNIPFPATSVNPRPHRHHGSLSINVISIERLVIIPSGIQVTRCFSPSLECIMVKLQHRRQLLPGGADLPFLGPLVESKRIFCPVHLEEEGNKLLKRTHASLLSAKP